MKLVWTKSKLPASVLIRAITGEDCSHFAIVFESSAKGLMFHSNFLGVHPQFYTTALKSMEVVHEMDIPVTLEIEDIIWDRAVQMYDGKSYDYLGAIYIGYRKLLSRLFGIEKPKTNPLASADKFYCDEIYEIFHGLEGFPPITAGDGLLTPGELFEKVTQYLNKVQGQE